MCLGWSSRPDPGEDKEATLLWALLAVPPLGWRVEETGSGKGILKKDDWLALAAVSVFIAYGCATGFPVLWGISPVVAARQTCQDQGKQPITAGEARCWAS